MKIAFWSLLSIYLIGFAFVFAINLAAGPVTPALSLLRAVVWPLWITTGRPEGQRMRMD